MAQNMKAAFVAIIEEASWLDDTTRKAALEKVKKIQRPRQNGRQFPDDNFKCIFLNKNT